MNEENLKESLKNRDRVISAITKDGKFRIAAIKNTNAARSAQERHSLPPILAFFLARQLAAASMLAVFLKGEERIILETDGDGMVYNVFAEAIQVGEVRGYVHYNKDIVNQQFDSLNDILGKGTYKVTRVLYSKSEPVTGIVPLQAGDISTDLSYYFFQSEQIPTAVILDTLLDDDGNIKQSSGIIIQAMPDATDDDLQKIYGRLSEIKSINEILNTDNNLENFLKTVIPFEFEIMKNDMVDFFCRCSKESFMEKLITFGLDEIKQLEEDQNNELICQYCNAHYYLDEKDFEKLKTTLQAKKN